MYASTLLRAAILGAAAIAAAISSPAAAQEPKGTDRYEQGLAYFERAVDEYVALHRRLERPLMPEGLFSDPEESYASSLALAEALRDARPLAREGCVFRSDAAEMIRARIAFTLRRQGLRPADLLSDLGEELLPGAPAPEVNRQFSWGVGNGMWPSLLAVLPRLPQELEYRFVGADLVLIDLHANMVVDILRGAVPADHV